MSNAHDYAFLVMIYSGIFSFVMFALLMEGQR